MCLGERGVEMEDLKPASSSSAGKEKGCRSRRKLRRQLFFMAMKDRGEFNPVFQSRTLDLSATVIFVVFTLMIMRMVVMRCNANFLSILAD